MSQNTQLVLFMLFLAFAIAGPGQTIAAAAGREA
jgi:hypothetical protein